MCKKTRYSNRALAIQKLARIKASGIKLNGKIPIRAYPCPECGGWHLTSIKGSSGKFKPIQSALKAAIYWIEKKKW